MVQKELLCHRQDGNSFLSLVTPRLEHVMTLSVFFFFIPRLSDDHHAKSHSMDSAPAYFLVLVRLVLLGVFLVGAIKTFEAEQSSIRREFIGRLVVLGSLWFAVVPVLVLVAMICAEYVQEPVRCFCLFDSILPPFLVCTIENTHLFSPTIHGTYDITFWSVVRLSWRVSSTVFAPCFPCFHYSRSARWSTF